MKIGNSQLEAPEHPHSPFMMIDFEVIGDGFEVRGMVVCMA